MPSQWIAFAILISTLAAAANDPKPTPAKAVEAMHELLAKQKFATFYEKHCHEHMRRQIEKDQFVEFMKGESGLPIIQLIADVHSGLNQKKGEDVLIGREVEGADEYEFILVPAMKMRTGKGQQWHLELKLEEGQWKLKDTD
jgi:hypothetical protein